MKISRFLLAPVALRRPVAARGLALTGLLAAALAGAPGCVGYPNFEKMDPIEKARAITQYNRLAGDSLRRYIQSDGQDLNQLEELVQYTRYTTEIAPSTCPDCFRRYGYALSLRGHHFRTLNEDVLAEIESGRQASDTAEIHTLEEEAEEYRQEMLADFEESNRAYRTYFIGTNEALIHPYDYERVMRHYELLGEYETAIVYLDRFVSAYPNYGTMSDSTRENIRKLREFYQEQIQLQAERGSRESPRRAPPSIRDREPAPAPRGSWRRR